MADMKDLFLDFESDKIETKGNYNTEDRLLQVLVLYGLSFSKNDILNFAKKLGIRMKNSVEFVNKYKSNGIIKELSKFCGVIQFGIEGRHWLDIIKEIDENDFKNLIRIANEHHRSYKMLEIEPFVLSVYNFFKGNDYSLKLSDLYDFKYYNEDTSCIFSVVSEMLCHEEMFPYISILPDFLKDDLVLKLEDKLKKYKVTDEEAAMIKKLIDSNVLKSSTSLKAHDILSESYGFFYCFVKNLDVTGAKLYLKGKTLYGYCFQAIMLLQDNKFDEAMKQFTTMLRGTGDVCFDFPEANFYYVWTLVNTTKSVATRINQITKKVQSSCYHGEKVMKLLFDAVLNHKKYDADVLKMNIDVYSYGIFYALVVKHFDMADKASSDKAFSFLDSAYKKVLDKIDSMGLNLLKLEFSGDFDHYREEGVELMKKSGMHPTMPKYTERPQWDYALEELLKINGVMAPVVVKKADNLKRIVYMVSCNSYWGIQPKLQTSKDGVSWSAGRNVALTKMWSGSAEAMTDADIKVSKCITCSDGWYGGRTYYLEGQEAVAALIGHPYVFDADSGCRLDVVEEKVQISMKLRNDGYHTTSNVNTGDVESGYYVKKDGLSTIKVVKVEKTLKETLDKLKRITFPVEAKDRLKELLERLSGKVVVMSELLQDNENIKSKNTHSETVVQLRPSGEVILCALVVKPFGKVAPVCRPGKGMEVITTTIDGETVQTKRNLKRERDNYNAVVELMVDYEENSSEKLWTLEAVECLELLDKLREMPKQCVIEWPEGERFRVSYGALPPQSFSLSVRKVDTWFEISGDVQISADRKMKIAELMERLLQAKGNFVRVTDNEYVKLSGDLRRYIDMVERLASVSRDKMKISVFNAPQLEGLENSGMNVTVDESYGKLMEKIHNSQEADIRIPKAIKADLRSYQKEGYIWMSRLAQWGAGALLADDMGLGKTVQTITLLLSRAREGAQLVIVPTSLVMNWKEEIGRFAPGLNTLILNKPGEDRKELIDKAGEYDIVVTTYGLLINEEEILKSRVWHTIVLDEAHTIKNRDTKMSKAAMELKSDFRVLLTGTPLQNNVSEIWNLMQFANPGLLGSFQEYTERFLLPIERDHDKEKQKMLKLIISPFMLRRTKNDVLNELPEKTEITLKVDLSDEEWAFYDNIRQKALANMEDGQTSAVQALAEITRLRQAACNSRLVEKKMKLKSSKLERFMELVEDLHESHHRALVFSQFTSHLALVRERLDAQGIKYLYLDGATSAKDRINLVEEFQHGDMDLFLISLKAGGLGLNLTAADYVVHLDPWWNPAVEDQASDRAYRIGQKKAVTVYRLIAAGTIEEKIIELHHTKKNMADALLEGGDVSARMTREEIMDLLKLGME